MKMKITKEIDNRNKDEIGLTIKEVNMILKYKQK